MAIKLLAKIGRLILLASPVVIVVVGMFAALPWLKQQDAALSLSVSAAAAIFVLAYSYFFERRHERSLDEVMLASQRFAYARGTVAGWIAVPLLMILPPVSSELVDLANMLSTGSADMTDRDAVRQGVLIGFMLLVLMQVLGMFIAGIIWWVRRTGSRS